MTTTKTTKRSKSATAMNLVSKNPSFQFVAFDEARANLIHALPEDTELTKGQEEVLLLAVDCQIKAAEAVMSYFELCIAIRTAKMGPREVRPILAAAGFPASRISEIGTVAFCSEQLFREYASRSIGFKIALEKARASKNGVQATLSLPDGLDAGMLHKLADLLGQKRKASFEVEGMTITISRKKPAENNTAPAPSKAD